MLHVAQMRVIQYVTSVQLLFTCFLPFPTSNDMTEVTTKILCKNGETYIHPDGNYKDNPASWTKAQLEKRCHIPNHNFPPYADHAAREIPHKNDGSYVLRP